jgi:ATP-binding cassette subfamily B protein
MPVGFYERRSAGVLISRMTNDVDALNSLVTDTIVTLFQATLTLLGSIVILLLLDWQLALLVFLIFPVMAVASLLFRIASADAYKRTRETIGSLTGYLQETLSGVRVVRAFAQEPVHRERFRDLNESNRSANMATVNLNAVYFPSVELIAALAVVLVIAFGGLQAIDGAVEIGVLVGFIAALNGFFDPITQLSQVYTTYQSGMAALDKIFELLDTPSDLVDAPDAIELPSIKGAIEFSSVSFAYQPRLGSGEEPGETKLALDDVSVSIAPGETVALVGSTGAGKSTFAKLIARFYDPTSGAVSVDGHDLRSVTMHSLRSQMGIVPQEGYLFSGTIAENLAFARPDAPRLELEDAAKAVADGRRIGINVSDEQAWTWLSYNPAKALGIADRTGSLKPGKMADIVLWNGNPLSVYSRPDKVWIDGALMYDAADPKKRPVADFELGQPGEGDVK